MPAFSRRQLGARPTGTGKTVWFTLAAGAARTTGAASEKNSPARHGRRSAQVATAAI